MTEPTANGATTKPATRQPHPVRVDYFYRVRWGYVDEWLDLFRRNHWPLLRAQLEAGRFLEVSCHVPRFHGDGRADWNVLVTIVYRDWAAVEGHAPRDLVERLYPDQERFRAEERRRFELLEAHWDVPLEPVDLDAGGGPRGRPSYPTVGARSRRPMR